MADACISIAKSEFQAVILDTGGSAALDPLLQGNNFPRALLPIGNRPLLSYQLQLFERAGFSEILVVTSEKNSKKISDWVTKEYMNSGSASGGSNADDEKDREREREREQSTGSISSSLASNPSNPKPTVVLRILPEDIDTADALREIRSDITTEFFVISIDTIVDALLHHMADVHRLHDSVATVLFKDTSKDKEKREAISSSSFAGSSVEWTDYIGLDSSTSRLWLWETSPVVERHGGDISIPKRLLNSLQHMRIRSDLMDSHLYLFSPWIFSVLDEIPKIHCIKTDLLPYLVKHQRSLSRRVDAENAQMGMGRMSVFLPRSPIPSLSTSSDGKKQKRQAVNVKGSGSGAVDIEINLDLDDEKNANTDLQQQQQQRSQTPPTSSPSHPPASPNAPLGMLVSERGRTRTRSRTHSDHDHDGEGELELGGQDVNEGEGEGVGESNEREDVRMDPVLAQATPHTHTTPSPTHYGADITPIAKHAALQMSTAAQESGLVRCYGHTIDAQYCGRVMSLVTYLEANRDVARGSAAPYLPYEPKGKRDCYLGAKIKCGNKSQVSSGSVCGEATTIGCRSSVKRSVVGRNVRIGDNVKVTDCVIMDGVVIEDNVTLSQSLICVGSVVGAGSVIQGTCLGAGGVKVPPNSELKGDVVCLK